MPICPRREMSTLVCFVRVVMRMNVCRFAPEGEISTCVFHVCVVVVRTSVYLSIRLAQLCMLELF